MKPTCPNEKIPEFPTKIWRPITTVSITSISVAVRWNAGAANDESAVISRRTGRENWRRKWSDNLFGQIAPVLKARGDAVVPLVATGVLTTLTAQLLSQYAGARVLDARRVLVGRDLQPIAHDQATRSDSRWSVPGAVAGMGAMLILAAE